jgi:hypothetical protein
LPSSFTQKIIELEITIGGGVYGETVVDTISVKGLRMTADMSNPGGESMCTAHIRVWGLKESDMNRLTTIGYIQPELRAKNTVTLSAGDSNGIRKVYVGSIIEAWANYNAQPNVPFEIIAQSGGNLTVTPSKTISIAGIADATDDILKPIALDFRLGFTKIGGASPKLENPYFVGDAMSQIRECSRQAGIWCNVEKGSLVVNTDKTARLDSSITISPETGLVGYPAFSQKGMNITMQFNPDITYYTKINVQSSLKMATREWILGPFTHSISCEMPNGPWFTHMELSYKNG